jgi:uncharacterized protein (TIRG00374 family)
MAIVAALLGSMVMSGKLSWELMASVLGRSDVIAVSVMVWILGPILLGTLRWWYLMRGAGLECDFSRAVVLQLIGFFFNTAMPGAVGGDIVKATYIVKDQTGKANKTPAMLSVVLDRIVGLIGLFAMGTVTALLSVHQLNDNQIASQLVRGLLFVIACSCFFLAVVFVPYSDGKDPVLRILSKKIPGFTVLKGIYIALRNYREKPKVIFGTIGISVLIQLIFLWFMGFMGRILYGPDHFDIALLAPVFPFGILSTAIPLAPGGLGVGHAAFEKLFAMVGLPGGAEVFNVYVLSQLLLNLLGFIPYLALKPKLKEEMAH